MRIFPEGTKKPSLWPSSDLNATRPLAELLIDDEQHQVRLRARWKWLRWFMQFAASDWMRQQRRYRLAAEWEAPLALVTAEGFGKWEMTRGVLLSAPDAPPAIFWCDTQTQHEVLDALLASQANQR